MEATVVHIQLTTISAPMPPLPPTGTPFRRSGAVGDFWNTLAALDLALAEDYIIEANNRQKDTAVIEALNVGDLADGFFAPLSKEAVVTLAGLSQLYTGRLCLVAFLISYLQVW